MDKIENLLAYLARDYRSHSLEDIADELQMERDTVEVISNFFARYGFIKFNSTQVKIDQGLRDLYLLDDMQKTQDRALNYDVIHT